MLKNNIQSGVQSVNTSKLLGILNQRDSDFVPKRVERVTDKFSLVPKKNSSSTFQKGYDWEDQGSNFKTVSASFVAGTETRRAS